MMNDICPRIQFKGFWDPHTGQKWFIDLLKRYNHSFTVLYHNNPDIIICSCFDNYHKCMDCSKKNVFYTGENIRAIKEADLNLTFDNHSNYNNIRIPLWLFYRRPQDKIMTLSQKKTRYFCCFVYSNSVPHRNNFLKELSKYKTVHSGGRVLNNIRRRVKDKISFQKHFKFCIAYENSVQPGYTTEKIIEAYISNCIPIYYGSDTITDDFNPETFINAHDFDSNESLIEYIKKVDTDENLYNSYMNKPIYSKKWLEIFNDPNETYFKNIAQKIIDLA